MTLKSAWTGIFLGFRHGEQEPVHPSHGNNHPTGGEAISSVQTWIGTNDTPGNGQEWEPTNNTPPSNMIQVSGNVYDGGGVGDSDLTQATQYRGGSAANRVTNNYFDWRDRLVATKSGPGDRRHDHAPPDYVLHLG
jgi:hypothetical protein